MTIDEVLPLFRDRYRTKLGCPNIEIVTSNSFCVVIGYDEFRGLYMREARMNIRYDGRSAQDLVAECREKQRELDAALADVA